MNGSAGLRLLSRQVDPVNSGQRRLVVAAVVAQLILLLGHDLPATAEIRKAGWVEVGVQLNNEEA